MNPETIRLRVCLAAINNHRILLVPHPSVHKSRCPDNNGLLKYQTGGESQDSPAHKNKPSTSGR